MSISSLAPLVVLLVAVCACGSDDNNAPSTAKKPETFGVYGKLTLTGSSIKVDGLADCIDSSDEIGAMDCAPKSGVQCQGDESNSDIVNGAQVTVSNSSGKKVALGELSDGALAKDSDWPLDDTFVCQFTLRASDVPVSGDIYSLSVGSRPPINFKKSEAASVALSFQAD